MRAYVVELGHRYCPKPLAKLQEQTLARALETAKLFLDANEKNPLFEVSVNPLHRTNQPTNKG